jgi:hypothetical protein
MSGDLGQEESKVLMEMLRTVRIGIVIMAVVYLGYEMGAETLLGFI